MKAEDWRDQMLHSSRAILALNGTLMIILGGAFWMFPEFFTLLMFPDFAENQQAIDVGVALRKNMGAGCAFIGVILFSCQSSPKSTAQRLLFSSAIGFLLMVTALLQVKLSGQADVPLFILIFFSALCVLSLFVASRRHQE
jgi:hypothetical protein